MSNTGGRALDIGGSASLSNGPGAMSSGPFSTARALTLAPGSAGQATITLPAAIVNGKWTVELTFTSGLVIHTKTVQLTISGAEATPAMGWPPVTFWWLILLALLIILLSAIAVYRTRRRSEIAVAGDSGADETIGDGYYPQLPAHSSCATSMNRFGSQRPTCVITSGLPLTGTRALIRDP